MHGKKVLNFSKWRFFPNSLLFIGNLTFLHISTDFVTVCEKFLFQLKALQKRMQKEASRFFVAQAGPEIYEKNEMLKNRVDVFFCYSLYLVWPWFLSLLSLEKHAPIFEGSSLVTINLLIHFLVKISYY